MLRRLVLVVSLVIVAMAFFAAPAFAQATEEDCEGAPGGGWFYKCIPDGFYSKTLMGAPGGSCYKDVSVDWGDGSTTEVPHFQDGQIVSHQYTEPGYYYIWITYTLGGCVQSPFVQKVAEVVVEVPMPSSNLQAEPVLKSKDVVRGGEVVLDGSKSTGEIKSYKWTFGPSTSDPSPDGVGPRSGAQKTGETTSVRALLSFTATLTVSDGTNEDSKSVEVMVTPREKWETTFKQVKKEGILTGAPLRASNTTFSLGQNLCGEDYPKKEGYPANELAKQPPDYIHGYHELDLPVSERKLSWEGEAYQLSDEPIADPGGPFDGYYYVAKGNLRIVRMVLLNEDLHNKQIRNFNLLADKANKKKIHDFDELVKQVGVHEGLHSVLQKEALDDLKENGKDPAKKIEAMAGDNKEDLIKRADVAIVEANTAISDASAKEEEIGERIKKAHPEWDRQVTILLPISDPAGEYKPVTFDNLALMGASAVKEE